jgi:23S rRNA (adenine2030-N6)-methyltransferase
VNYRHSFHAGNFADLLKHAALLRALDHLQAAPGPLTVIDTHGGAGRYPLDAGSLATGEAVAAARLAAARDLPSGLAELQDAARREGRPDAFVYPGSPLLAARRLRPGDRLTALELRPDEHALLSAALRPFAPAAEAVLADGYEHLPRALNGRGRALVLIDPPYERGDDYARVIEATAAALRAAPAAAVLIWAPLKDLETFDRLLRDLESGTSAPGLALELRLRPPLDPLRMNGCGLIALGAPSQLGPELEAVGAWIARELGEPGGRAVLRRFGPAQAAATKGAQRLRKRL